MDTHAHETAVPQANKLTWFLLGVGVAAMALLCQHSMQTASAQDPKGGVRGGSGSSGGLQALGSGMVTQSGGMMWVYDAEAHQLAAYVNDRGQVIRFVGARKVSWDLKLRAVNDKTDKKYTVTALEMEWKKLNEAGNKKK